MHPLIPVTAGLATASRPYRDGRGQFLKWMGGGNPDMVRREWEFLYAADEQGVTAHPLRYSTNWILMEDLGDPAPYTGSDDALIASAERLLVGLRAAGICHNDLRPHNLIWRDRLLCFDFSWSRWAREDPGPFDEDEDEHRLGTSVLAILKGAWG